MFPLITTIIILSNLASPPSSTYPRFLRMPCVLWLATTVPLLVTLNALRYPLSFRGTPSLWSCSNYLSVVPILCTAFSGWRHWGPSPLTTHCWRWVLLTWTNQCPSVLTFPWLPAQRRPNKLNAWPKPIVSQPYTSLPVCLTQPTLSHHKHPILLSTPTLPWTIFFSDISPFSRNPTTFHPHAPSPTIYTYFHKRPWSTSDLTDID